MKNLFFSFLQWVTIFLSIASIALILTSVLTYTFNPPITKEEMEQTTTEQIQIATDEIVNIINEYSQANKIVTSTKKKLSNFVLSNLPPVKYQGQRSTCWAFSTIFQLEYQYNKKLENKYISLNEQAYAIDAVEACKNDNFKGCPKKKFDYSTNTGYPQFLWRYSSLGDKVIPNSICPYTSERKNETDFVCEGKTEYQKKNPLKFDVKKINTFRTINEIKENVQNGPISLSLVLSEGLHVVKVDSEDHFLGKIEGTEIKQCPHTDDLCAYLPSERITADGEHVLPETAVNRFGYHIVTVVGYNDNYLAKDGSKGAFIVRDSTPDSSVYGSHSYQYLKGEHSDWDERTLCPNVYNPLSWDSCVYMNPGPTGDSQLKGTVDISATCLNEKYIKENVLNTRKPTEFECIDENICDTTKRYFVAYASRSEYSKYLFSVTFLQVDKEDPNNKQQEIAFVDVPLDAYHHFIKPIDSQIELVKTNNTFCGYRSLPYSYLDRISMSRSQDNWYGVQFEIEWAEQSYEGKGDFDYTEVKNNIFEFPEYKGFMGPEPYQKRYDN